MPSGEEDKASKSVLTREVDGHTLRFSHRYEESLPLSRVRVWHNERGNKLYDCECGRRKPCPDLSKIKKHAKRHDEQPRGAVTCPYCDRRFAHYLALNAHLKAHKDRVPAKRKTSNATRERARSTPFQITVTQTEESKMPQPLGMDPAMLTQMIDAAISTVSDTSAPLLLATLPQPQAPPPRLPRLEIDDDESGKKRRSRSADPDLRHDVDADVEAQRKSPRMTRGRSPRRGMELRRVSDLLLQVPQSPSSTTSELLSLDILQSTLVPSPTSATGDNVAFDTPVIPPAASPVESNHSSPRMTLPSITCDDLLSVPNERPALPRAKSAPQPSLFSDPFAVPNDFFSFDDSLVSDSFSGSTLESSTFGTMSNTSNGNGGNSTGMSDLDLMQLLRSDSLERMRRQERPEKDKLGDFGGSNDFF